MKKLVAFVLSKIKRPRKEMDIIKNDLFALNISKDPQDPRDYVAIGPAPDALPSLIDYSGLVTVKNQGLIGSCGSHAAVTGLELLDNLKGFKWPLPLSELFHYWMVRQLDYFGTFPEDSGQTGREAMRVLNKVGVCPETLMPYEYKKFNENPGIFARSMARFWKITDYERCFTAEDIKGALEEKRAVWLGIPVQDAIRTNHGEILHWIPEKSSIGGHAMLVCGYDDSRGSFRVVNSWGDNWGSRGFGWVSYEYLKLAPWFDCWSFA